MHRSFSLLCCLCFALTVTVAVVFATAAVATNPPALAAWSASTDGEALIESDATTVEATARRFFAAANTVIGTGDPAALNDVVTPTFTLSGEGLAEDSGRDRLAAVLTRIGSGLEGARLTVDEVVVVGDRALVTTRLTGADDGPFRGLTVDDPAAPWASVAMLRVAENRVAEYHLLVATAPHVHHLGSLANPSPAAARIAIARVRLDRGANIPAVVNPGPALLVIETGAISLQIGATNQSTSRISGGEAVSLPVRKPYNIANDGVNPVEAIALTLFPAATADTLHDGGRPDFGELRARSLLTDDPDATTHGLPLVRVTGFASGGLPASTELARFSLNRVTLDPGQALAAHQAAGPELIVVETGVASVVDTQPSLVPDDLIAGEGLVVSGGQIGPLLNAGTGSLSLLVVTAEQSADA